MSDKKTPTCYFCLNPAVIVWSSTVTPTWAERFGSQGPESKRGRISISGPACADHSDALSDALSESLGAASGEQIDWKPIDCPDPFHTGESDGEEIEVDTSGTYRAYGFRCPTCGLETLTKREPKVDDEAYTYVVNAIGEIGSEEH